MNNELGKKLSKQKQTCGQFFVVATPIGNLDDFSFRAQQVLKDCHVILVEDTRHSKRLLNHYGINSRLRSCHEHNETEQIEWLVDQLDQGFNIALISDAGTPLISDPGFVLVRTLRQRDYRVTTIPGPSALIAALSISGLPTDQFLFDGFLPSKSVARKKQYEQYLTQPRTVAVYESSHRIIASIEDCIEVLGSKRQLVLARELTKKFETIIHGTADHVLDQLTNDDNQTKGEFVVLIEGAKQNQMLEPEIAGWLNELLTELPIKKASSIVAKMSGYKKRDIYDLALRLKGESGK